MEELKILKAVLTFLGLGLLTAPTAPLLAEKRPQTFAVVAGTVFQESGRSLPGAQVTITPKSEDASGSSKRMKALKAVTDTRGEFAVRVPAGAMRYNIRAMAKGFQPEEKEVTTSWDERVDAFFRLKPAKGEAGESK